MRVVQLLITEVVFDTRLDGGGGDNLVRGILAVEDGGGLLQGAVLRLDDVCALVRYYPRKQGG